MIDGGAAKIASGVRTGTLRAQDVVDMSLARIDQRDGAINSFTTVTGERARKRAQQIDAMVARGEDPGPLTGVPFAAKDLFDLEGITTIAGSSILADRPPAVADAEIVRRLEDAGGILVGALNMEELAYGFLTDNAHYGRTRNPHDLERTAGGSSGGSGAAVAAGMVPLALASDTNGSTRIPASFCGAVGFKPTFGRISRAGMTLLAPSQDHVGWIGSCVEDVALAWRVAADDWNTGPGTGAPVVAVAGGYFAEVMTAEVREAVARVAELLGAKTRVEIPHADVARAAAYAITSIEASSLRMDDLRAHPARLDPATRDRFLAGALLPGHWYIKAQRFRSWFRRQLRAIFDQVDIIVMPANPFPAPRFGEETIEIEGTQYPVRPTIGRFTQAISSLGLPVICIPAAPKGNLPVGVQLMARPGQENLLIETALRLEKSMPAT